MAKTGYDLSRQWFDWCFENPDLINTNHTALYFFCIEHCNRLGWKEKFGLPTTMAKEAIGIRSYNTYINTLNDLVNFGFIVIIERSKNQYSSNIIALSNFNKAPNKALDKALIKHVTKQSESTIQSTGESICSIDKQYNQEQRTSEQPAYDFEYFNHLGYSFKVSGKVASEIDRFLKYRAKHQLHGPIKSGEQVEAIVMNFKDLNYSDEMISRAITDTISKGAKNIICEQKPVTGQQTGPKIKNLT